MDSLLRPVCHFRWGIIICGIIGVAGGHWGWAQTLNDGTTTNQLVRLANSEATSFGNITAIHVSDDGGSLVAEQIDDFGIIPPSPALRSVWYAGNAAATGGVYRVSSEFVPAAASPAHQGGTIGWLNIASSNGIVLKVVPASAGETLPFSFQLSHVDFTGTTPDANENLEFLFNMDGTPAANSFDSSWSEPTGYATDQFARFELEFTVPTADHLIVVSNATALVTARVYQGAEGGAPVQVGRTIELLTTLAVPTVDVHRVGYYGVWSSFLPGNVIGNYRNLEAEGELQLNQLPVVILVQPAPGTTNAAPATFSLEANATDADGTIVAVEFFEGTNSLAVVTSAPFVFSWSGVAEGNYVLTAVATDNLGARTVSGPVEVAVQASSGSALMVEVTGDTIHLAWDGPGFQLQYKTSLTSSAWTDVPSTTGVSQINLPTSLGAQYFRLVGSGTPAGPRLSLSLTGDSISISWPAATTGYRLQSSLALGTSDWTDIETTGNAYSEIITGAAKFYRLIQ